MPLKTVKAPCLENVAGTVIVPDSLWASEISRCILPKDTGVLFGKKIISVRDFVGERCPSTNTVIPSSMQRAIIRKLLKNTETKYFKTASNGTVNLFSRSISALKKNGIAPEEFENILQTRGGEPEADLLKIYFKYESELSAREFLDEESLYNFKPPKEDVALIGFDFLEPWMDKLNGTFFEIIPKEQPPEAYSFNSPLDEISFLAEKLASLPKNTGIYTLNDEIAWQLLEHLTGFPRFTPQASLTASRLFNHKYPAMAKFADLAKIAFALLKAEPAQKARNSSYISHFYSHLTRLEYEYSDELVSKDEFLSLLFDNLPSYPLPDFIKFVPMETAGLFQFDIAFLPRANEGLLPQASISRDFFTSIDLSPEPDERIERIFPPQSFLIKRQLKHFQRACSGKLIVTYPTHDNSGKEISASPFIINFPQTRIEPKLSRAEPPNDACGTDFQSQAALKELSNQMSAHKFSATQLEDYAECPFAYFCKHILEIEPPDEITPEVQAKDRGTLIHQILEEYFINNKNRYESAIKNGTDAGIFQTVKTIVENVFLKNSGITQKYNKDMANFFKERSLIFASSLLETELEFLRNIPSKPVPSYFELEFDDKIDGIPIRGKIDRIDSDGTYLTVIDYKTGDTSSVKSGIEKGQKLQLPIYAEMARRLLKKEPIAAFLYSVKERKRSGIAKKELNKSSIGLPTHHYLVTNEKWDELIDIGLKTACEYAKKIKEGKFRSSPHKCKEYCDWKDVCRWN